MRREQQQAKNMDIFTNQPNPYVMKFLNAAYQKSSSTSEQQQINQLPLQRIQSDTTANCDYRHNSSLVYREQVSSKKHVYKRKTPLHQGHKTITYIVCGALVFLFFFILVDIKYQHENRVHINKMAIKKCYQNFIQNQCVQPLDALVQRCNQYQLCMGKDPEKQVKYSQVIAYCIALLLNTLIKSLGIIGFIAIATMVLVYMHRPRQHVEQQIHKYL